MRGAARYGKWNALFAQQVNCSGIRDSGFGIRTNANDSNVMNDPNEPNESNDPNDHHYQSWTITKGYGQITEAWG